MEADWATIAVRFALYVDLMLLFGVPLAAKLWLRVEGRPGWHGGRVAAWAAGAGIVLSFASLVLAVKTMTGVASYGEIDSDTVWMIAAETDFGVAWQVRVFALLACLLATLAPCLRRVRVIQLPAAAIALSTLAWGGHGVMDEGIRHTVHLSADIIHLLAAGAWVGALVAFVRMSSPGCTATDDSVAELSRAANGFAHIGTGIVFALVLTGTVNYVMIAGPTLSGLLTTRYGTLLLAKLALFGVMLALAAVNRYRLGPRLAHAVRTGDNRTALAALRRSLRFESGCAMLVLLLVAWLGTLSPVP